MTPCSLYISDVEASACQMAPLDLGLSASITFLPRDKVPPVLFCSASLWCVGSRGPQGCRY